MSALGRPEGEYRSALREGSRVSDLRVFVQGIGLLGPGLASWAASRAMLSSATSYVAGPALLPAAARLPPAERRRAGAAIKLALAVADEAVAQAGLDPQHLATVFSSSSGEGTHCHALCETMATPAPMVSPTRFTNSVHNAAAGCWHIAVASRAPSTSLCAFDASFAAGLLEAATLVRHSQAPVLLVCSDSPYPEPLHAKRPVPDHFGMALVLAPAASATSLAALELGLAAPADARSPTLCDNRLLDALRVAIPAAASLPLMQALARDALASRLAFALPPTAGLWIALQPVSHAA